MQETSSLRMGLRHGHCLPRPVSPPRRMALATPSCRCLPD